MNYFKYLRNIENKCRSIIETELDLFFNSCLKSAYPFSLIVSMNPKNYAREIFENTIISESEIIELIKNIANKLNHEMNNHGWNRSINNLKELNWISDSDIRSLENKISDVLLGNNICILHLQKDENEILNYFTVILINIKAEIRNELFNLVIESLCSDNYEAYNFHWNSNNFQSA